MIKRENVKIKGNHIKWGQQANRGSTYTHLSSSITAPPREEHRTPCRSRCFSYFPTRLEEGRFPPPPATARLMRRWPLHWPLVWVSFCNQAIPVETLLFRNFLLWRDLSKKWDFSYQNTLRVPSLLGHWLVLCLSIIVLPHVGTH